MQATALICSIFAISISSMDLALAIIWGLKAEYKWSKFLVVFMATVLGLVFSYVLFAFADLIFSGTVLYVFSLVWEILFVADVSFLFVFIPIFINWVIARPFPLPEKIIFSVLAGTYLTVSIVNFIVPLKALDMTQMLLFFPVLIYTVVVMAKARREIEDKGVRHVTFTIEIVSLSVLPLQIASIIWSAFAEVAMPIIALSYFITVLVFLFCAISKQRREDNAGTEEKREDVRRSIIEEYHITDREMEVIDLIKRGMSNKEIASELNISVNTVNNHISNAFTKTGVRCRIDLLNLLKEASW